jgi:hypothetical protein
VTANIPKPADARRRRTDVSAAQAAHRLPVTGRPGAAPKAPSRLGPAGRRWWRWAWSTPQSNIWHNGYLETICKRAELEDTWANLSDGIVPFDAPKLASLMLRFDTELGLTPMAAAKLHYAFVDEPEPPKAVPDDKSNVTSMRDRLKGMRE